ncbi:MAG: YajQ family cyclic di-GMP-binding protein [Acidobacteria bacterium]|nr:YajQ family cyclic di-GMP-binding protein [Acidobacteriota bacterium]
MAAQPSFDITSTVDLQEVDNAVNQAKKELAQRYDFKGSKSSIDLKAKENLIELVADDNFKMDAVWEILQTRLVRRSVPTKNMKLSDIEQIGGGLVKRKVELQQGVSSDAAREITKFVKDQKLKKIQVTIQGDQLRVTSGSKDELQNAIRLLRAQDFGVELQFGNFRD